MSRSYVRLIQRLERNDLTALLITLLRDKETSCLAEVFGVVLIEDEAIQCQSRASAKEKIMSEGHPAVQENGSTAFRDGTEWMPNSTAESTRQGLNELVRSEPKAVQYDINPDPNCTVSEIDVSIPKMLSNRADKMVWAESRKGGYWRCLLPWILSIDLNYEISTINSGKEMQVVDITAPHRKLIVVHSFQELCNDIAERLGEDLIYVSRHNQTMPPSWLDPEVRTSLILLIAGARGVVDMGDFSPCLQLLIVTLRDILYCGLYAERYQNLSTEEQELRIRKQARRGFFVQRDENRSKLSLVTTLYLPAELHCCYIVPPENETKKKSWIGVRWHEETMLLAPGHRKDNVLHADSTYLLANSNTFGLHTQSADSLANTESWIIGALTPSIVFQPPSDRVPRSNIPHIQFGAHSLEMFWMAAERALGASIGVLWTENNGVVPAVIIKGPISLLEQFAAWVPDMRILGNGFAAPPALSNRKDRHYFSRGKLAARVWTQGQLRSLLARKKDKLEQELGLPDSHTWASSYIAHSVADCVILYLHVKYALPVTRSPHVHRWALQIATAIDLEKGLRVFQRIMLPPSIALRVVGTNTVEVVVDSENKIVWRSCEMGRVHHQVNELDEYFIQPDGDVLFERIATGTVEDAAFFVSDKRVYCGLLQD